MKQILFINFFVLLFIYAAVIITNKINIRDNHDGISQNISFFLHFLIIVHWKWTFWNSSSLFCIFKRNMHICDITGKNLLRLCTWTKWIKPSSQELQSFVTFNNNFAMLVYFLCIELLCLPNFLAFVFFFSF